MTVVGEKVHDQELGLSVERSVKVTVCPTCGVVSSAVKSAVGGDEDAENRSDSHNPLPKVAARSLLFAG